MSRTIRRKNVKPDRWITHEREWEGYFTNWIPLEGKALGQSLAKFYGDHGWSTKFHCGTGGRRAWENDFQRSYRQSSKQEIHKYFLNDTYEVMICKKPPMDYWD